jgi:hypothetical protein
MLNWFVVFNIHTQTFKLLFKVNDNLVINMRAMVHSSITDTLVFLEKLMIIFSSLDFWLETCLHFFRKISRIDNYKILLISSKF